jgi:ribosomal protein S12 methylthiotransferase accessory factor
VTEIAEVAGPRLSPVAGTVGLLGGGPVAEAIVAALPGLVRLRSLAKAKECGVAIAVGSAYADNVIRQVNKHSRGDGLACLPVQPELGGIAVGPLALPGQPGCHECARIRAGNLRAGAAEHRRALWDRLCLAAADTHRTGAARETGLGAAAAVAAALVADDVAAVHAAGVPRSRGAVLVVDSDTLVTRRHSFLPVPDCPVCGGLPGDTPARAVISLQPCERSTGPAGETPAPVATRHEALFGQYVDERFGLIAGVEVDIRRPLVTAAARVSLPGRHVVKGFGRLPGRASAEVVAIFEALERYGGLRPRGKRTTVNASFAELGPDRAIDPVLLGVPDVPPAPGGPAFTGDVHNTAVRWVYGYSLRYQRPILVPEGYAYYGTSREPHFAYECSNGCALGSTLEQAILHAIYEVAERDAFLITWYARLPLPRLDPRSIEDDGVRLIIDMAENDTGMRFHVFDATMPEGIPSLWVSFVDEDDRPGEPKAYFSAGAHLDPERALRSALMECAVGGRAMRRVFADPDVIAGAREMLAEPDRVTQMEHHAWLNALPEAWPRLDFLYQRERIRPFAEAFPPAIRLPPQATVLAQLTEALDRYRAGGLDVIVVDQTAPEHRAAGLACVKAIIPGTLPMTFGHRFRRAASLPRLGAVPVQLGYRARPLTHDEINPHPHPFP